MAQPWSSASHQGQITINASVEKIFDVLANMENIPAIIPGLSNFQRKNNNIYQAIYSVQVFGLPLPLTFPCEFRLAESQKPTKVVYQVDGLVKGTLQWNLQPSGKQTLVSGSASYQMGLGQALNETTSKASSATGGLLGGLTGGLTSGVASTVGGVVNSVTGILPLLTSVNEGNFNTMLTNLKVIGENLRA